MGVVKLLIHMVSIVILAGVGLSSRPPHDPSSHDRR